MDWAKVKAAIGTIAPWLAGKLGTPMAGVAVQALCGVFGLSGSQATPDNIQAALAGATPQQLADLRTAEDRHIEAMAQMGYTNLADLAKSAAIQVVAVNQTLQADARGDSFWQKNHHAFESSFVVLMVAFIYAGLPVLAITVPAVPESVWVMLGAILGITAWQHGEVNKKIADQ